MSKGFDVLGISLSPIQIDYMLNSYTGGWIRQLPIRPVLEPADIPIIGDLLQRMPERPQRQVNSFFDDYESLTSRKAAGIASNDELRELNRIKPLYRLITQSLKTAKKYHENKEIDRIRSSYRQIQKLLERYGYE